MKLVYMPMSEMDQRQGNVYFVACDNRYVKIGFAADVPARLSELQVGCPFELKQLGVFGDVPEVCERWFHAVLRDEHVRGEWFNLTETVRLLIHKINAGARPQAVLEVARLYGSCPPPKRAGVRGPRPTKGVSMEIGRHRVPNWSFE